MMACPLLSFAPVSLFLGVAALLFPDVRSREIYLDLKGFLSFHGQKLFFQPLNLRHAFSRLKKSFKKYLLNDFSFSEKRCLPVHLKELDSSIFRVRVTGEASLNISLSRAIRALKRCAYEQ